MTIGADEIRATTDKYLKRFPDEREQLTRLLAALDDGSTITSRTDFRGHVTCGAVLIDPDGRVLHIRHNALDRWLLPGGHVEPEDACLRDAALREAFEETGIAAQAMRHVLDFETIPFDIDVHAIPTNAEKCEPDHWHFDIRHAFHVPGILGVELQQEEVSGATWLTTDAIPATRLRKKLRRLAALP
ncbi:MAG: NUDIX hydrolase [Haloechinothrix sp.]